MNRVLLSGRLTRDPELRTLASGKRVAQFTIATNEYIGDGRERAEFHTVVLWDRLAEIAGKYLTKGREVLVEGRLQTRSWEDGNGERRWKTEVVAGTLELIGGRPARDGEPAAALPVALITTEAEPALADAPF
jgi:single-strand DNA-binding protein